MVAAAEPPVIRVELLVRVAVAEVELPLVLQPVAILGEQVVQRSVYLLLLQATRQILEAAGGTLSAEQRQVAIPIWAAGGAAVQTE